MLLSIVWIRSRRNWLLYQKSGESSACSSQSLGLITPGDSMNAEIFWLAKVSVSNLSLQSVDNIGDLFRAMFPDSNIAAQVHHT